MKIDIAESLIRSWLRHVENCILVETNWKAPSWTPEFAIHNTKWESWFSAFKRGDILNEPALTDQNNFTQFIDKAEIDALGLVLGQDGKLKVKAVDVAFHRDGLGYNKGGQNDNRHRVAKKMLRSAIIVDKYFPDLDAEIIFATPKTRGNEAAGLKQAVEMVQKYLEKSGVSKIRLRCIFDEEFQSEILTPTIEKAESVADTGELFLRAVSLGALQGASKREDRIARQSNPPRTIEGNYGQPRTVASVAKEAVTYICNNTADISIEKINALGLKTTDVVQSGAERASTSYQRYEFPKIGLVWYNNQWPRSWEDNGAKQLIENFNALGLPAKIINREIMISE